MHRNDEFAQGGRERPIASRASGAQKVSSPRRRRDQVLQRRVEEARVAEVFEAATRLRRQRVVVGQRQRGERRRGVVLGVGGLGAPLAVGLLVDHLGARRPMRPATARVARPARRRRVGGVARVGDAPRAREMATAVVAAVAAPTAYPPSACDARGRRRPRRATAATTAPSAGASAAPPRAARASSPTGRARRSEALLRRLGFDVRLVRPIAAARLSTRGCSRSAGRSRRSSPRLRRAQRAPLSTFSRTTLRCTTVPEASLMPLVRAAEAHALTSSAAPPRLLQDVRDRRQHGAARRRRRERWPLECAACARTRLACARPRRRRS